MKLICKNILAGSLVFASMAVAEDEQPEGEEPEAPKIRSLSESEAPVELDKLTVTSQRFSFEVEAALNFVKQALETPRSYKREGKDIWSCRFTRYMLRWRYLECARGGDWNANMYSSVYPRFEKGKNYGTIWKSRWPVNAKEFRAMLGDLPGPAELDVDFAALAQTGRALPEDAPDAEELDLFTGVFQHVQAASLLGSSRSGMVNWGGRSPDAPARKIVDIIEASGMTLDRYNRIVELMGLYKEIQNEVAFRIGTLTRPEPESQEGADLGA